MKLAAKIVYSKEDDEESKSFYIARTGLIGDAIEPLVAGGSTVTVYPIMLMESLEEVHNEWEKQNGTAKDED